MKRRTEQKKRKKNLGHVSLLKNENATPKKVGSTISASCYCNCGCDCYVTG